MANDWMKLVMKTKRENPGKSLKQVMKMAKKKYHKKGGGEESEPEIEMPEVPEAPEGARRRGGNKLSPLPVGGRRKTRRGGGALSPAAVGGRRKTKKAGRR